MVAPRVDIFGGGFPCQPFSRAGLQMGFTDGQGRGLVVIPILRYIAHHKPKGFWLENVGNLQQQFSVLLDVIVEILGGIKDSKGPVYHIEHKMLDSSRYGIPQHRERVYIVGWRRDCAQSACFTWPKQRDCPPCGRSCARTSSRGRRSLRRRTSGTSPP